MKKILVLAVAILLVGNIVAQNVIIRDTDGNDITYSRLTKKAESEADMQMMLFTFNVCNETGQELSVDVRRKALNEVEGTINDFCFNGQCYTADSLDNITWQVDQVMDVQCHYIGLALDGVTTIKYSFIANNDTAYIIVNYIIGDHVGIDNNDVNVSAELFPNPAASYSTFTCNMPEAGSLSIYSCTGQKLQTYPLAQGFNKVNIDVATLQKGIYICAVDMMGRTMQSKKLVVR